MIEALAMFTGPVLLAAGLIIGIYIDFGEGYLKRKRERKAKEQLDAR